MKHMDSVFWGRVVKFHPCLENGSDFPTGSLLLWVLVSTLPHGTLPHGSPLPPTSRTCVQLQLVWAPPGSTCSWCCLWFHSELLKRLFLLYTLEEVMHPVLRGICFNQGYLEQTPTTRLDKEPGSLLWLRLLCFRCWLILIINYLGCFFFFPCFKSSLLCFKVTNKEWALQTLGIFSKHTPLTLPYLRTGSVPIHSRAGKL